ncbi:MAG TPA: ATPase, T2SS/T4P/T4SS family [Myxococcales bacterium]
MAFDIVVREKAGPGRRLELESRDITVGRAEENDICLPRRNISKKHTRIAVENGAVVVSDLASTNGTWVNGTKLDAPRAVGPSDRIHIGDFVLTVEPKRLASGDPKRLAIEDPSGHAGAARATAPQAAVAPVQEPTPAPAAAAATAGAAEAYGQTLRLVHDRLIEALDLRRLDLDALGSDELREKADGQVRQIVARMGQDGELDAALDRAELVGDVLNEALGLGPLEHYLADETVSEIMVNGPSQIYVERAGRLQRAEKAFSSAQAVLGVIERIVAPVGRHIDESSPLVDARLRDGSRFNAIIPPLALKGPCITIRKFKRDLLTARHLIGFGALTAAMAEFLDICVKAKRNLVISGGTGSGKTTLLNVLSSYIPPRERIVTVEDAAELQLTQDHWVQLEARPANIEGKGQIAIRDLVRNSLRMRPDRIVVGECRGGEALDMLQAMNTGHDGSLTTLHANSPRDALSRLETLVLMSGMELPVRAIREQIASAVHLIVQQTRFSDGSRKVTAISEISGMEMEVITLQDIFRFQQDGFDAEGRVTGKFVATGFVPRFYDEMQRRGIKVNMEIFREEPATAS